MSIRYAIGNEISNYTSCYGSINGGKFFSYKSKEELEDFDGIRLYLSKEAVDRDFPDDSVEEDDHWGRGWTLLFDAMGKDYVREMMRMARAVGFGEYIPRTIGKLHRDGYLHFDKTVPFYIVVAVTGFFRAWDGNHENVHIVYDLLKRRGLNPYTAFCASQSLDLRKKTFELYYAGEHSIVPYCIFNQSGVNKFKTWKDRVHTLPSMYEELKETGVLNFNGRDEWFGAYFSGNSNDPEDEFYCECESEYEDRRESFMDICASTGYIKEDMVDVYSTNTVDIDRLVEGVKQW